MTDYLPRKSAKRSLHNHCRGYHRGDPDIQQQQVPADRIAGDVVQRNSEGRMSDHVNKVQYHGGVGHGHDRSRAEGEDGVVPPLVVLLLPGGTSPRRGPHWDQSLIPQELSPCLNLLYVHRAGACLFAFWLIPLSFNTCFKTSPQYLD